MNGKKDKRLTVLLVSVLSLLSVCGVLTAAELLGTKKEITENDISQGATISEGASHAQLSDIADIKPSQSDAQAPDNDALIKTDVELEAENEPAALPQSEDTVTVSVDGYDLANAVWPVDSKEIVMAYSYNTTPVYSATFNEYRSDHAGIDIKAAAGEEVKCAYAGKVVEITNDGRLGKTIKVQHTQDILTIYANLDDKVSVSLNQNVTAGQTLGKVGNTAVSESAEDTHLHFGVMVFSEYTDPLKYIKLD